MSNQPVTPNDAPNPTPQERAVLALLQAGLPNKEIAARLHLSVYTVREYVSNLLEKYAVYNRTELVAKLLSSLPSPQNGP